MKTKILIFVVSALAMPAFAQTEYYNSKGHFTLMLPYGWMEIPRGTIDEYERMMQRMTVDNVTETHDAAFQLEGVDWFTYPYVLVIVKQDGKLSEAELMENLSSGKWKEIVKEGLSEAEKSFSSLINNSNAEEPVYDKTRNILFTKIHSNVATIGSVTCVNTVCLNEKGYIQIAFYSRDESFQAYLPQFDELMSSLKFDEGYEYKSSAGDKIKTKLLGTNSKSKLLVAIAILVLLGIIVGSRKKNGH